MEKKEITLADDFYSLAPKYRTKVKLQEMVEQELDKAREEREREVLEEMTDWVIEYYKDKWQIRDFDAETAIEEFVERRLSKLRQ